MKLNAEHAFTKSIAALLVLTAAAKLYSVTGVAHILEFPDPLLGLPNRYALMIVAGIELAVAACAISNLSHQIKHLVVAWLGLNFLLYRLALTILKPGSYCKCLGTVTEKLHLDDRQVSCALTVVALYLAFGSIVFYLRNRRSTQATLPRGAGNFA